MSNTTMMIHNVALVRMTEKEVLDYGSGKCYKRELHVVTEDGSTFTMSLFMEKVEEPAEEVEA